MNIGIKEYTASHIANLEDKELAEFRNQSKLRLPTLLTSLFHVYISSHSLLSTVLLLSNEACSTTWRDHFAIFRFRTGDLSCRSTGSLCTEPSVVMDVNRYMTMNFRDRFGGAHTEVDWVFYNMSSLVSQSFFSFSFLESEADESVCRGHGARDKDPSCICSDINWEM